MDLDSEAKATDKIKSNPKVFFAYSSRKRSHKANIGPLKTGNNYTSDSKKMAEILNNQYKDMFSYMKDTYPPLYDQDLPVPPLVDLNFSEDDLIGIMKKISPSSASGHDQFPSFLLKHFAQVLAKPLCILWRRSLDSGLMPEGIIKSIITPISVSSTKNHKYAQS